MKRAAVHALTGAAAALAVFICLPHFGLTAPPATAAPDLAALLHRLSVRTSSELAAMTAAFLCGALVSLMLPPGGSPFRSFAMRALAALNPALIAAAIAGPETSLTAAASLIAWRGVFLLAAENDHRSTILLALALAAAPLFSHQVFFLYPLLLLLAPLLSPWGLAPRRAAGFLTVLIAPLALIGAGAVFLFWLFAVPMDGWGAPVFRPASGAAPFLALLAAPGILLAAIGLAPDGRSWKAALIFVAVCSAAVAITAYNGPGALAVAAAGHVAWAAQRRRALALLAAGFLTGGALTAADFSPLFRAAVSDLAGEALARIAPAPANP